MYFFCKETNSILGGAYFCERNVYQCIVDETEY